METWSGKGEVVPKRDAAPQTRYLFGFGGSDVPDDYWSNEFQWLPANVVFEKDGTVKFTSYINNLHPKKYPEIYRTIEKLVDLAIPAWDQCLAECDGTGAGRREARMTAPESYKYEPVKSSFRLKCIPHLTLIQR